MRSVSIAITALTLFTAGVTAGSCNPFPQSLCKGIKIEDATVDELQRWMILGNLTSHDLVECYIARIHQTNKQGIPTNNLVGYTHSISEINPDALSIATAMDEERARSGMRSNLHGIPFVVKDNFYTDDKHNTSEGTLVLLGGKFSSESTAVVKMRAAGGVLLGHATMDEAADHRALTKYSTGYSSRTGQTRNPYNFTQPTAGSSSGPVVAVRANQAAIALGTETYGSLTHPSAQLGLYTIKSTPGLCSRHGIVTGSFYHDTPGPLARSMKDVAMVLDIITGYDRYDNLTSEARYPENGYAAEVVGRDALRGLKLGLPWYPYWSTIQHINAPGNRAVYEKTVEELKAAGAEIYNITNTAPFAGIANPYGAGQPTDTPAELSHSIAFATLLAVGYGEWLQNWTFPEDDERYGMSTLAEMAAWNVAHNDTTGALGNNTWWWDTTSGQTFYDAGVKTNGSMGSEFWTAFGWSRFRARQAIDAAHSFVTENGTIVKLDGLLIPNGRTGGGSNACASLPSYAGYPIAAVPIGMDGYSTPYGLCVYGQQYSEAKLVRIGSAMGDLFRWNEKPSWHGYQTARGPSESPWPGYTCSTSSLDNYACDEN